MLIQSSRELASLAYDAGGIDLVKEIFQSPFFKKSEVLLLIQKSGLDASALEGY